MRTVEFEIIIPQSKLSLSGCMICHNDNILRVPSLGDQQNIFLEIIEKMERRLNSPCVEAKVYTNTGGNAGYK